MRVMVDFAYGFHRPKGRRPDVTRQYKASVGTGDILKCSGDSHKRILIPVKVCNAVLQYIKGVDMKSFKMRHVIFEDITLFSEDNAPSWLSKGGLQGSTLDNRWFFEQCVLTLKVGQSVSTDFHIITRVE